MKSRLFHVYQTYWTRPLCLLLAIPLLAFAAGLLYTGTRDDFQSQLIARNPKYTGRVYTLSNGKLHPQVAAGDENQVHRLWLEQQGSSDSPQIENFTELEYLSWTSPRITLSDAQSLLKFSKLHSMELVCQQLDSGVLTLLGSHIEDLRIPSQLIHAHLEELPKFSELHSLRVDQSNLSDETIAGIALIPNLRKIVFEQGLFGPISPGTGMPNVNGTAQLTIDPAGLEPLIRHPHLREVYADWSPKLLENRRLLTDVHAYPNSYPVLHNAAGSLSLLLMLTLAGLLAAQLGAQFLIPSAMVIPGYGMAHKQAALLLLIGGATFTSSCMLMMKIAFLPAVAVSLAAPVLLTLLIRPFVPLAAQPDEEQKSAFLLRLVAVLITIAVAYLPLMILIGAIPAPYVGIRTWFFQGHYPLAAIALIAAELVILTHLFLRLERYALKILEGNPRISGLSLQRLGDPSESPRSSNFNWAEWEFDRRLERLQHRPGTFWQRVRLLQLGNPYRPVIFLSFYLLIIGVAFPLFRTFAVTSTDGPARGPFSDLRSFVGMNAGQLIVMLLVFPMATWFRRRQSMETEFCRPFGRQEFARLLFASLALDQAFALIPTVAFAIFFFSLQQVAATGINMAIGLSLIAAIFSFGYAAGLSIFAFRTTAPIYAIAVLGLTFFSIGSGLGSLAVAAASFRPKIESSAVPWILISITVILWGCILWLQRKTREREWG